MAHIQVKSERVVNARPEQIYAVLSDYVNKRPQILTPNFLNYKVEKGGKGSGTVVSYRLQAASRERDYKLRVDEPVKGQIITERDANSSLVNTWTLSPLNDGARTRVSIINEWDGSSGMKGFFERTFAPLGLKNIYGKTLGSLNTLVAANTSDNGSGIAQVVGTGENESTGGRIALFLTLFGLVVGAAFAMNYLSRRKRS